MLLDSSSTATVAYGYDAYGDKDPGLSGGDADDQDPVNPFRYTAKRFDSGSQTLDMGARRFGPDTTRFLQQDQFMGALSDLGLTLDPLTQNRYGLAGGNPLSFIEWDGHVVYADGSAGAAPSPNPSDGDREGSIAVADHEIAQDSETAQSISEGGSGGGAARPVCDPTSGACIARSVYSPRERVRAEARVGTASLCDVLPLETCVVALSEADDAEGLTEDQLRQLARTGAGAVAKTAGGVVAGRTFEAGTRSIPAGWFREGGRYEARFPRTIGGVASGTGQVVYDALGPEDRSLGERLGRAALAGSSGVVGTSAGVAVGGTCTGASFGIGAPVCAGAGVVVGAGVTWLSRELVFSPLSQVFGWGDLDD